MGNTCLIAVYVNVGPPLTVTIVDSAVSLVAMSVISLVSSADLTLAVFWEAHPAIIITILNKITPARRGLDRLVVISSILKLSRGFGKFDHSFTDGDLSGYIFDFFLNYNGFFFNLNDFT